MFHAVHGVLYGHAIGTLRVWRGTPRVPEEACASSSGSRRNQGVLKSTKWPVGVLGVRRRRGQQAPALQRRGCAGVCRSHADARADRAATDDVDADGRADDDGADHTHAVGCAQHRHSVAHALHPLIQPPCCREQRPHCSRDAMGCVAAAPTLAPTTSTPTVAPTAPPTTLVPTTMVPTTVKPSGAPGTGTVLHTRSIHSCDHHVAVHSARAAAGMRWDVCRSNAHARADNVIADVRADRAADDVHADDDGADHTHAVGCAQHRHTRVPSTHPTSAAATATQTHTHVGQIHANTRK